MITRRPLVSPVLVGRDELLDLAGRRIAEVLEGDGRFLLLAGEAGIGKTRLLNAIEDRAKASGFRVARGGAYPSDRHVQGAILIDTARWLGRSPDPDLAAAGAALDGVIRAAPVDGAGDAHRRRRILTLDASEILASVGASGPVLLELEDLHWSDDLTLQILETVAGRIQGTPLLIVGTYRSDELFPRVPMREWRARLTGRRLAEEVRLTRLAEAETATMTSAILGSDLPAARDLVAAVQTRSDGIPLHVEEILALHGDAVPPAEDTRPSRLPASVEDAIIGRIEGRSPEAIAVARAGAVIGRSCDLALLAAVTDRPIEDLAAPLAELADHFLLLPSRVPGRYVFRHALICDVIYEHIAEPERRRLHERTAEAAADRSDLGGEAFLAIQYERAGRPEAAFTTARSAATAASALSSHREAFALYEIALRTAPAGLPAAERAELLFAYATTAAATDDNAAADQAFSDARAAFVAAGEPVRAATLRAPHVDVRHLLGDDLRTREQMLNDGLAELDAVERAGSSTDGELDRARAVLLAAVAAANMLDRRLDVSIDLATEARRLATETGDVTTERHAATTLGSSFVFAGRMDEGWQLLAGAVEEAKAGRREADASRAYRMIGSSASVLVEYDRAERWLREGIDHAEAAETWNDRHYMAAHLAHVLWATGRWDTARDVASHALADGRGGITTRITALHVLGYVALGRGELDAARNHLDEARRLGEAMRELQRLSPALWGLAEVALAADDPARAVDLAEGGATASAAVDDAAYLYPFVVTGTRAYLALGDPGRARDWLERVAIPIERRGIPGTLASLDHGRGLLAAADGMTGVARTLLVAAAAGWRDRRRAWEGTWAQLDLARCHLRSNQRAEAVRAASAARDAALGLPAPMVARGAEEIIGRRRSTDDLDGWAPLSAREFEVARLVAQGRTNPEIAAALRISRKTVSAHVEHILDKLGVERRAGIAAWVGARPVLHSRPHGDDREE
ncbi:MAG TPA: AAA family ATPase [Candidatus Limnocylindrales bacterium]|nr:AAA family ATPase [Candidatus Limnocylindrales bacterium]